MTEKIYTEHSGEYLKNNPNWHIEDSPWKARQVLKMLNLHSLHPKSIAEVGCGAGEILNQLHAKMSQDVSFTGFDISADAINLAKQREKDRLIFKREDLMTSNETFDLLLAMDVFEHVEDYLGFLRLCKAKAEYKIFHIPLDLTIDGIMRNKLMDSRKSVGHIHYFTKETALATLADTGHTIVDYFYTEGAFELPSTTFKSKLALLPRWVLFKINKDFGTKILGGVSLLVLTK